MQSNTPVKNSASRSKVTTRQNPLIPPAINLDSETVSQTDGLYRTLDFDQIKFANSSHPICAVNPANREISLAHVRKIAKSLEDIGFEAFSVVVLVWTSIFTGKWELFVADGMHRVSAAKYLRDRKENPLNVKILVQIRTIKSKQEYVDLVARLNSTSRKFQLNDYLRGFKFAGYSDYIEFDKFRSELHARIGRTISMDLQIVIMSGVEYKDAVETFRDGTFRIGNKNYRRDIYNINEIQQILNRTDVNFHEFKLARGIYSVMKSSGYSHAKMLHNLKEAIKNEVEFTPIEMVLKEELRAVLDGEIKKKKK